VGFFSRVASLVSLKNNKIINKTEKKIVEHKSKKQSRALEGSSGYRYQQTVVGWICGKACFKPGVKE